MLSNRQRRGFSVFLLASTALSTPAVALEASGTAVRVTRITDADGPGGARPLETEGPVYMGDEITTNPHGLAEVIFRDDTKIVVGPNSRLVIDSFVFNADNTASEVTVDTVRGFFRFISGNSPHDAYTIRTPTMTIGLRGTVVDIHANGGGSRAAFLDGSGDGCDASGFCIPFDSLCRIYEAPAGGGFGSPQGRLQNQLQLNAYFPFIGDQSGLSAPFRADVSVCQNGDQRIFQIPIEQTEPEDNNDNASQHQQGPYQD